MIRLVKTLAGMAASSALDGTLNARDLKNNKKKVAFTLARAVGWTIVENHPVYVMAKLALRLLVAFLLLVLAGVVTWMVW